MTIVDWGWIVVFLLGLATFGVGWWMNWRADRRQARREATREARAAAARAEIAEREAFAVAWRELVANYDIADEYEPRLAERAIELPRTGEAEQ